MAAFSKPGSKLLHDATASFSNAGEENNVSQTQISHLAAKLLRDAAVFFRNVGEENNGIQEQMNDNATVYEQVADLLEDNPLTKLDC